jgi:hypothetical protein
MKNWLKVIGFAIIVGSIGLTYAWFFIYNKPHDDIEKAKPDYIISATECYQHYVAGKNNELENYTGTVLQIVGVPTSIEKNDSLAVIVFAFDSGMYGDEGIRCTMLPSHNEKANNISLSEKVTIKGYCSGYNDTDVILEQCSIINNNN